MCNFLKIILHHVQMPGLNEHVLPVTYMLQHRLIILLFLYNRFFNTEGLTLLPNLLLFDIIHSKLPELLFEHKLVVLVPYVVLNLLLAAF